MKEQLQNQWLKMQQDFYPARWFENNDEESVKLEDRIFIQLLNFCDGKLSPESISAFIVKSECDEQMEFEQQERDVDNIPRRMRKLYAWIGFDGIVKEALWVYSYAKCLTHNNIRFEGKPIVEDQGV